MKKPYLRTIIGSCGRDFVLIISFLHFIVLRLGFLNEIYSGWVSMTVPPSNLHNEGKTNAILITKL